MKSRIISSAIVGLCAIIAFALIGNAYMYRSNTMDTIVVTGLTEKDFDSDLIVWSGSYSRKSLNLKEAYSILKADENSIRSYLLMKGISANDLLFSSLMINKEFSQQTRANGQYMSQEFTGCQFNSVG